MPNSDPLAQGATDVDRGRRLVLSAALFWSLAGVFIKFLDLHPLTIVFYRSLFAALVFVPFLRPTQWSFNLPVAVSAISYSAAITAFVSANKLTTAANAIVLQYTAPIFVFLYARLIRRERITRPYGVALGLSMAGVALISFDKAGEPEMAGVILALLSGLFFAVYMVNLQQTNGISPVYLTWLNNMVCAAALLPFLGPRLAVSAHQAIILLAMGAVQLGLPYFLFSKGLRTVAVQEAALIALIEPVLNPVWVAFAVGEIPSRFTIVGGSMILLGLAVRYLWPLREQRSRRSRVAVSD